jgi:hypothetical protein
MWFPEVLRDTVDIEAIERELQHLEQLKRQKREKIEEYTQKHHQKLEDAAQSPPNLTTNHLIMAASYEKHAELYRQEYQLYSDTAELLEAIKAVRQTSRYNGTIEKNPNIPNRIFNGAIYRNPPTSLLIQLCADPEINQLTYSTSEQDDNE